MSVSLNLVTASGYDWKPFESSLHTNLLFNCVDSKQHRPGPSVPASQCLLYIVLYHCILVLYWVALDPNLIVIFIIAAVGLWVVTTSTMTRAPAPPSSQAVLATITSHSMRYYRSSPNICLCTTVPSLLYATSITSRLLWIAKSWFLW